MYKFYFILRIMTSFISIPIFLKNMRQVFKMFPPTQLHMNWNILWKYCAIWTKTFTATEEPKYVFIILDQNPKFQPF